MDKIIEAKDIKMAVIGYSHMGEHHFKNASMVGITPFAVVELDNDKRTYAKQNRPDAFVYASVDEMIQNKDVNLVTIITPHNTHTELAIKCLNAGKNVVSEKPFAISTEECDAMIFAANKNKVMLSTYHNRHWDGCITRAAAEIKSGIIGDVIRVEAKMCEYAQPRDWWRSSKSISGGILYDWGVHFLEYGLQLINSEIVEVVGYAKNGFWADKIKHKEDTNEDEAYTNIRFSNGTWLSLTVSSIDSDIDPYWVKVTGTRGVYKFNMGGWETIIPGKGVTVQTKGANPESEYHKFYQNIADHLTKDAPLIITPEWARRPIHILDLADKSAKTNSSQKAKYK